MEPTPAPLFGGITENPAGTYWVLCALAVVFVCAFLTTRRVLFVGGVLLMAVLAGSVWLIDGYVVTDREQVELNSREIVQAAEKGDIDRLGQFVARDFEKNGRNRDALLAQARKYLLPPDPLRKISVWDLQVESSPDGKGLKCQCMARATGRFGSGFANWEVPYRLEFLLVKEPDGKWRMKHYAVFPGLGNEELHVP